MLGPEVSDGGFGKSRHISVTTWLCLALVVSELAVQRHHGRGTNDIDLESLGIAPAGYQLKLS